MQNQVQHSLFKSSSIVTALLLSVTYLLCSAFLVGFKQDQLVLVAIFNTCFFASSISRKFITGFAIFIVYWIIFDYMKALPNYTFQNVHIADLYNLEKTLFGITDTNGNILTPNEYWQQHSYTFLNVATGFFYLSWVPVPLAFATYLFFKRRSYFLQFSMSFFLVNILGFIIYYIYPAAPPWYVQNIGFDFVEQTKGSCAGLIRFDNFFGSTTFQSLYSKGSNVFAAMPSLHASYPVIVMYYGWRCKLGLINWFFALLVAGIWFSAVYNAHHYVADVLAGAICAVLTLYLFNNYFMQSRWFNGFYNKFYLLIKP